MGLNSGTRKVSNCFDFAGEYQDQDVVGSDAGDRSLTINNGLGSTKRTTNCLQERKSSNKANNHRVIGNYFAGHQYDLKGIN